MQNLIIYNCKSLYDILEEISPDLNLKINFIDNQNNLNCPDIVLTRYKASLFSLVFLV